jgi:hypothetical protein
VKRLAKWGGAFAVAGSIFPVLYLLLFDAGIVHRFPDWGLYPWPTAIMLMATDGLEADRLTVALIEAASVGSNALLWFVIGMVVSLLVVKRAGASATVLRPNKSLERTRAE